MSAGVKPLSSWHAQHAPERSIWSKETRANGDEPETLRQRRPDGEPRRYREWQPGIGSRGRKTPVEVDQDRRPLCLEPDAYTDWATFNARLYKRAASPCVDCLLPFALEMRAIGRCNGHPSGVEFDPGRQRSADHARTTANGAAAARLQAPSGALARASDRPAARHATSTSTTKGRAAHGH